MDCFECQAPMYVNFGETSALDENDGADKFFDCEEEGSNTMISRVKSEEVEEEIDTYSVKSEPSMPCTGYEEGGHPEDGNMYRPIHVKCEEEVGDEMDICSVKSEPLQNSSGDIYNSPSTPTKEGLDIILSHGMRKLWSASRKVQPMVQRESGHRPPLRATKSFFHTSNEGLHNRKVEHNNKFISVAEAVRRFQLATPDRFHSKPRNTILNSSLPDTKGTCQMRSNTIPITPHLTSHLRSRPLHYLTREQVEEKEAKEMKRHQIKANPLNPKILEAPELIKVERKAPTIPVPFHLTEMKRKVPEASPSFVFTARPVPKKMLEKPLGVPEKRELPLTNPMSPACAKRSKALAVALELKNGVNCHTEKEVPTAGNNERRRTTQVKPFSFEERDKKLFKRREEAMQKQLEEEKRSRVFHATPLPSCIKSPNHQKHVTLIPTQPVPFQLSVDKRGMTKQELLKQKLEEEMKQLQQMTQFKARPATVTQKKPFEPKKSDRPLTDITAVELNTEKRMKEREDFDLKLKMKEAELDELRRQRDEEEKRKEMEEIARLRKEAVHKARPVPRYKPLEVLSSDKPLTDPKSPSFTHRPKANHSQ